MYETKIDEFESRAVIELSGQLTVQNAEAIKLRFSECIEKYKMVVLDLYNSDDYDLSFLQLLISLNRTAGILGKKIYFNIKDENTFFEFIGNAGYHDCGWIAESIIPIEDDGDLKNG